MRTVIIRYSYMCQFLLSLMSCLLHLLTNYFVKIPASTFNVYMSKIEEGYRHFDNPYQNSCHGADVGQTIHYIIVNSGLKGESEGLGWGKGSK